MARACPAASSPNRPASQRRMARQPAARGPATPAPPARWPPPARRRRPSGLRPQHCSRPAKRPAVRGQTAHRKPRRREEQGAGDLPERPGPFRFTARSSSCRRRRTSQWPTITHVALSVGQQFGGDSAGVGLTGAGPQVLSAHRDRGPSDRSDRRQRGVRGAENHVHPGPGRARRGPETPARRPGSGQSSSPFSSSPARRAVGSWFTPDMPHYPASSGFLQGREAIWTSRR